MQELLKHLTRWLDAQHWNRRHHDHPACGSSKRALPQTAGQFSSKKQCCLPLSPPRPIATASGNGCWQPHGNQLGIEATQCEKMSAPLTKTACAPEEEVLGKIEESMLLIWQLHQHCKDSGLGVLPLIALKVCEQGPPWVQQSLRPHVCDSAVKNYESDERLCLLATC